MVAQKVITLKADYLPPGSVKLEQVILDVGGTMVLPTSIKTPALELVVVSVATTESRVLSACATNDLLPVAL